MEAQHTNSQSSLDIAGLTQKVREESAFVDSVINEVQKVIVGQRHMVERVLIGLLAGGHVLLEGVPGLAKTLTLTTLSQVLRLDFKRVQFTPDLLPSDLTGTSIWDPEKRVFEERVGPIMSNLLLADEINRAPAKVQSALLEAMQERKVTLGRKTFELPWPFFVMATQNPVEQEGTYPLPEAQMDRFMLKVHVGYPTRAEERTIMERFTEGNPVVAQDIIGPEELKRASEVTRNIYIDEKIKKYIVDLVFASREPQTVGLSDIEPYIQYGASPRATLALATAARAHAFLQHRGYVTPDDIKAIGLDVLRHRVHLTFEAEAEEVKHDEVVQRLFEAVPVP
ncbi:MAG: ATPase [Myxococcales bacterium]|nr:ATPase [Myxococcales bacterium]